MCFLKRLCAYVALGGQVGLHGHGVLDHQLRSDLAEQVESGDARHQTIGGDAFFLTVCNANTENMSTQQGDSMPIKTTIKKSTNNIVNKHVITCKRLLIFQYVLDQIVHQLDAGFLCRFV